jgi:deazaflavin-dependent oxidoreductase (nitroreductase family)
MHDIEQSAVDSPHPPIAEQARQYLDSGGQTVDHPYADRLILLYVRGRSSGVIRRVPLVSLADGNDLIIVASKGGAPEHPAWYLNLEADPNVWVRNKDDFFEAEATTLEGQDRALAWARIIDVMPFFAGYETKTDRVIPVIRLNRLT